METLQIGEELSGEVDDKNMKDDKDEGNPSDGTENRIFSINMLDFSDDVLLLILKNLPPRDLKALSFTCTKFASLVLERSLWRKVDARGPPCGTARFKWLLNSFHGDTTSIMLTGYAQQNVGCWGHHIPKEGQVEPKQGIQVEPAVPRVHEMQFCARNPFRRQHALFHIQARQLPRVVSTPAWPDEPKKEAWELVAKDFIPSDENQKTGTCTGPRFTFTAPMFLKLIQKCPNLTTLVLEYCNLNCKTIHLSQLSPTLKTLSLKGLKCFNFLVDRSFLFKLQDALPNLETLDLSECDWLDPSSFLPLSKLNSLIRLRLCNCPRLSEFVAYSSLATRYGFRVLQELDLRGSPVSDSEVSSLSWLPELRVLRLAAQQPANPPGHRHHLLGHKPAATGLDDWEIEDPDIFNQEYIEEEEKDESELKDTETKTSNENSQYSDTDSEELGPDDICRALLTPETQDEKKTTKRKQEDGSGDADVNRDAPSCSKSRKTDETDNKGKGKNASHSGSDDDKDGDRIKLKGKRSILKRMVIRTEIETRRVPREGSNENRRESGEGVNENRRESGEGSNENRRESGEGSNEKRKESGEGSNENRKESGEGSNENRKESGEGSNENRGESGGRDVNFGASTSWERSRHVRGFVCVRRNRAPEDVDYPLHRAVYVNFDAPAEVGEDRNLPSVFSDAITFYNSSARARTVVLVTDSSVRQFGRADGENITYVNFGPNGPMRFEGSPPTRPARSNLRFLSMVGYTDITDRSLTHLATAAPFLEFLDFRGTGVTAEGVQNFLSLRPDCTVLYGNEE